MKKINLKGSYGYPASAMRRCPYIITIQNKTNKFLSDVPLINHEHYKQKKCEYGCSISCVTYDDILRFLIGENMPRVIIYRIMVVVVNKNPNLILHQLKGVLKIGTKNINGNMIHRVYKLPFSKKQQQQDRSVLEINFPLYAQTGIIFERLCPKTKIYFYLFPSLP